MTVCPTTGIAVPECSCRACLEAQIERHMPSLLGTIPSVEPNIELSAASGLSRLRFGRRLRRFKRAA